MTDLEQSKYQYCEWRISIYGRSQADWDKLAKWIVNNKLFSHNVRWLVQVPRLYDVYKLNGSVETFEDIIRSASRPACPCALVKAHLMATCACRRVPAAVRGH